jgi:broad specificity phosphatase PhoE
MKKRLKIYLFRHGQTVFNKNKFFTGWSDSSLTKKGIINAKKIASLLKNKKFEVAFQSDLGRSKETLKEIIKFHPECVIVITDKRIRERNYGILNGSSHKKAIEKYGLSQFEKWHRGFFDRPPRGESFSDVEKRVRPFISDLIKYMKKHDVDVAISAHGNFIRLFRKIMEKSSVKEACSWAIPYERYYEYSI